MMRNPRGVSGRTGVHFEKVTRTEVCGGRPKVSPKARERDARGNVKG